LWIPHPSVPRRDNKGACKQDREHPSIALTGPRLRGSTRGYTSWKCTGCRRMPSTCAWHRRGRLKYCRRRLKLTPRTPVYSAKKPCRSTHALARLWGYTRGCASAPPRNSTTSRREEHPISKHQPLRDPNRYHRRGSGATVGDNHRGPLKTEGKPIFFSNNENTNELTQHKTRPRQSQTSGRGPRSWRPPRPTKTVSPSPPRNSISLEGHIVVLTGLRLARGLDAPSGETPPRSRVGRPLG
jgi:hypothetical protein